MGPTSYTWSFITPINGLRNGVTGVINTTYQKASSSMRWWDQCAGGCFQRCPAPWPIGSREMMAQGVSGTCYMERFGGYGKQRDLGIIQFQVMTCMDFLQMENLDAARDSLSLLAVMLEQATLDGGSLELGQLLTLTDDPPSAIFTNRTSQTSRAKAFSPLADQRWVTTALAYIKELDTITSKRLELTSARSSALQGGGGDLTHPGGGPVEMWYPIPLMLTTLYNGTFMTFLVTKICLVMLMVLTTPLSSYVDYFHYDLMMCCPQPSFLVVMDPYF